MAYPSFRLKVIDDDNNGDIIVVSKSFRDSITSIGVKK